MLNNYIVIEGLEGSGKTTACGVVSDILKELGIQKIVLTREPGGTKLAERLRSLLLDTKSIGDELINDKTEMLIFYAARIQLIENFIKPALAAGNWVISDRHDLSTQAYQGGGRNIDKKILKALRDIILSDICPGLTLYLDITPEESLLRTNLRNKPDRIENESLEFFHRTRARYLELVAIDNNIYAIDAMQPLDVVICTIRKIITNWFRRNNGNSI